MKKLIVLSGNSPRNQAWGEACVEHFSPWFDGVYMQYYDHWQEGTKEMNVEAELAKLQEAVAEPAEYYVLAKSIGSLLTLLAVHRGFLKPEKCVFFGMPLELAGDDLFKGDWSPLSGFAVPAIAFHNDHDPINYPYTEAALREHNPEHIELITLAGDNHDYLDLPDYEERIKDFLEF